MRRTRSHKTPYDAVSHNKHFIVDDFWCIFIRFNYFGCDKIASRPDCLTDGSAPQKQMNDIVNEMKTLYQFMCVAYNRTMANEPQRTYI